MATKLPQLPPASLDLQPRPSLLIPSIHTYLGYGRLELVHRVVSWESLRVSTASPVYQQVLLLLFLLHGAGGR